MSDNLASKITDSELEVMKLLWCAKDALPVTEIREKLHGSKGWEPATIKTLVSRLVSKGVVRQEKRNVYYYSPVITERNTVHGPQRISLPVSITGRPVI